MEKQRTLEILPYLPANIRRMISDILADEWITVEEIRLRSGAPLTIGVSGESCFVTSTGGVSNYESDAYKVSDEEVQAAFSAVCENSVYAHMEEIRQGFITIKGGHRVGICGKVVCDNGEIRTFREISSLNFRVAHQVAGIADGVIKSIICGNEVKSTLIISPPQTGKTTLLRDIARQVSDRGFKCGIADDRGELAAMYKGIPSNDVGAQTDVIDSAPKALAIEMLLRTMSPKVIISDEIASERDAEALRVAAGTGVKIIASTHGDNVGEVLNRRLLKPIADDKIFEQAIILKRDYSLAESLVEAKVMKI